MNKTGSDPYKSVRCEERLLNNQPYAKQFLFKYCGESAQSYFRQGNFLSGEETPILCWFENDKEWWLATSRKVIWSRRGSINQLSYSQIKRCSSSEGPEEADTSVTAKVERYSMNANQSPKLNSPWICIIDVSNMRNEIELTAQVAGAAVSTINFMVRLEAIHPTPN
jgi:hypothetical protein